MVLSLCLLFAGGRTAGGVQDTDNPEASEAAAASPAGEPTSQENGEPDAAEGGEEDSTAAGYPVFDFDNKTVLLIGAQAPEYSILGDDITVRFIAIRWHLQAGNICIPGSSNEQHIIEDYDVWDFELTEEEMAQMAALNKDERFAGY